MDVFGLRDRLVDDYASYIKSFIHIRESRIDEKVDTSLKEGLLWPNPLIQLNPSFETGEWINDLVDRGVLHSECGKIFRIKPEKTGNGDPLRLHRHQSDAILAAKSGDNYVLTTGTGSGKSLAYLIPIVDHVLRNGKGKGIQAIVVYPMNALCNSQYGELEKFLCHDYPRGHEAVRFAKYTGQEEDTERQAIIANPPDIILTNYVMLELILTRPEEKKPSYEQPRALNFLFSTSSTPIGDARGRMLRCSSGESEMLVTQSTSSAWGLQRQWPARVLTTNRERKSRASPRNFSGIWLNPNG